MNHSNNAPRDTHEFLKHQHATEAKKKHQTLGANSVTGSCPTGLFNLTAKQDSMVVKLRSYTRKKELGLWIALGRRDI